MTGVAMLVILAAGAAQPPRLEGTFVQYSHRYFAGKTADDWRKELQCAEEAGLKTLIIQRLSARNRSYIPESSGATPVDLAFDPTDVLLHYADAHGQQVFLGMEDDPEWWQRAFDEVYLGELARRNLAVAKKAWAAYGGHPSVSGWYIPQEPWDVCPPARVDAQAGFFKAVSDGCKEIAPGKPVAIAPFFSAKVTPRDFGKLYSELLGKAKIDIVMLQDGVGARGLDGNVSVVVPYFDAMREACRASGTRLWADVETFTRDFHTCEARRLRRQIEVEAPYVERLVCFEFFHYANPSRGEPQRILYEACIQSEKNAL